MKKKKGFLFPILSVPFLLGGIVSCGSDGNSGQTTREIVKIQFEGEKKTSYHYGDTFVSPTIIAVDDSGNTYDVTEYCSHTGFSSYKIGTQTVVITYYSFTLSYEITVTNEVKSIAVEGQRTSFEVGDEFSLGGGKVYKVYDNGDRVELNASEYQVSGFSSESAVSLATVTITYGDFTITYSYSVKSIEFVAVSIAFSNVQENYDKGDAFVRPTAIATDANGETLDVSDSVTYSGFDSSVVGSQIITGTYKDVSNTFSITINEVEEGGTSGVEIPEDTVSKAFSMKNDENSESISAVDGVYLVDATQDIDGDGAIGITVSGKLTEGQIKVNAPDKEVELTLNGVSISNSSVSPVDVVACGEIDISVKKKTANYIYDNRPTSIVDEDNDQYGAAIYVEDGDLTLKKTGQLYLKSLNNNGIHGKDDVKIKNVGLVINAVNNGIKGNDSVTFEESPAVLIECGNDGIKTSSTDLSSKQKQMGSVSIFGGEIEIQSYGDGIDAAYDLEINTSVDVDDPTITYTPKIDVYTGSESSFKPANYGVTSSFYSDNSRKGLKSTHDLNIKGGEVFIKAYDDAIHGNKYSDDTLITYETGASAVGNVTISGGKVEVSSGDDGVHADGITTISGAYLKVNKSTEGIEGFEVHIEGGESYVFANDDGINASGTSQNSSDGKILVSGGYLDVTVPSSGDVDGIDANGYYTQTGGTVVVRGPANGGAWSLDTNNNVTLDGGTLVVVGGIEASSSGGGQPWHARWGGPGGGGGPGGMGGGSLIVGSNMNNATSSTGKAIGSFRVTAGDNSFVYTNTYSYYGSVIMYSEYGTPSIAKVS